MDLFYPMYEHNPKRTKVLEKNLNRIKAVIEMQSFHRYFVGNEEQTDELKTNEELGRSCLAVMPFNKIEINTNDEVWLTADQDFLSPWGTGYSTPSGIVIKITEYLR